MKLYTDAFIATGQLDTHIQHVAEASPVGPPRAVSPDNPDAWSEIAYSDDEDDNGYKEPGSSTVPSQIREKTPLSDIEHIEQLAIRDSTPPLFAVHCPSQAIVDTVREPSLPLYDMGTGATADGADASFRDFMSLDDAVPQAVFRSARDALLGGEPRESFAAVLAREHLTGPDMQIRLRDFLSARDALASLTDGPASFASVLQADVPESPDEIEPPAPPVTFQFAVGDRVSHTEGCDGMHVGTITATAVDEHNSPTYTVTWDCPDMDLDEVEPPVAFKFAVGDRVVSHNERCDGMQAGTITAQAVDEHNEPTYTVLFLDEAEDVGVAEHHMFKMPASLPEIVPKPSILQPLYARLYKRVAHKTFVTS